jgi:hypothetical protein
MLRDWKQRAENQALIRTKARTNYREIAQSELRTSLTPGEAGVLHALSDEFGCKVRTNTQVPFDQGCLNLHAAVVRGEDLVAIEIHEYKGGGFPDFAIEYLINTGAKLKFPRFRGFVLYVVVVSEADQGLDETIRERLNKLASNAPCEVYVRMFRTRELLAKYNL